MSVPADRKYSETHEWYKVNGNVVTMGISQFAADELTDITYVEVPEPGSAVKAGAVVGEIESVKATSELMSAVAGRVVAANETLVDKPEIINDDAFGEGWILKIEVNDMSTLDALMDAKTYEASLG